jgi:hypothetical protein
MGLYRNDGRDDCDRPGNPGRQASHQENPCARILAAYPTIQEHHLDLAVSYVTAHPLKKQPRKVPSVVNATLVKSGTILRQKR